MKEEKKKLTTEQLDANYKKFINGKELMPNCRELFEKVIKKAAPSDYTITLVFYNKHLGKSALMTQD